MVLALIGLRADLNSVRDQILSSTSVPTLDEVFSRLLRITSAPLEEEHNVTSVSDDHETTCWGCGLRVLVSPHVPAFKCFWCGAITNQNVFKNENQNFRWRRLRDRCFVSILIVFMLLIICGSIWAIYPAVVSAGYIYGSVIILVAIILSISTLSTFSLSAFRSAGAPPNILWGSYPAVTKGALENYRFCEYCSKPKSPRAHHCRSCGMCVLDMDHHCPFQLCFIYEGKTYLSHISASGGENTAVKDCQNFIRFFGFPCPTTRYLPSFFSSKKTHKK